MAKMGKASRMPAGSGEKRRFAWGTAGSAVVLILVAVGADASGRSPPQQWPEPVAEGAVQEIVDGDTVVLKSGVEVRLVGIQAPKLPLGRAGFKAWPLAPDAKDALSRLVLGKRVSLHYGGRRIDRHGRLLAHLSAPDGVWVQGALLRDGMARVYTFPDNRTRVAEMLAEERDARAARRGIWRLRYYRILDPVEAAHAIGTFQLVEGSVVKAAIVRGRAYLNFGENWRKDFTVTMSAKSVRRHWRDEGTIRGYEGRRVRVRGWLRSYNGPLIEATHPEQIEVLP